MIDTFHVVVNSNYLRQKNRLQVARL